MAFKHKNQYMGLWDALAGIVFLGTPHPISEDDKRWNNIPYAIDPSYKAKNLPNLGDRRKLTELSSCFVEAVSTFQVLSCHELGGTRPKSFLLWPWKFLVRLTEASYFTRHGLLTCTFRLHLASLCNSILHGSGCSRFSRIIRACAISKPRAKSLTSWLLSSRQFCAMLV